MRTIRGRISSISFSRGDFYIFRLTEEGGLRRISCKGSLFGVSGVREGLALELTGRWSKHPRFGPQFEVAGWSPWAPTEADVEVFLTLCLAVPDIRAEAIVDTFGLETFEVLDNHPDRLSEVPDLDELAQEVLLRSWSTVKTTAELATFLSAYDVTSLQVQAVISTFGAQATEIVKDDPYRLVDVDGFPFTKADQIARRLGIRVNDPRRYNGAVLWVLKEAAADGHLCVRRGKLVSRLRDLAHVHPVDDFEVLRLNERVDEAVERLQATDRVVVDEQVGVYLPAQYRYERESARMLAEFMGDSAFEGDVEDFIRSYESRFQLELSDLQRDAIRKLAAHKVLVLTGLPGTGKTTAVKAIVAMFEQSSISYTLMAPTGIAAKRLAAVTGRMASTIHRAFGYDGQSWAYDDTNKYPIGAIVVDEMSMVDQELLFRVLDALEPDTMVVFVGDDAQLPSVGPGNVLRELIHCNEIPTVRLNKIFRQSQKSKIICNSHRIHAGKGIDPGDDASDFRFLNIPDEGAAADLIVRMAAKLKSRDAPFQVLSSRYGGTSGVDNLNDLLREVLNPKGDSKREIEVDGCLFREGDRVMVTKNDYQRSIYNGDMAKLVGFEGNTLILRVHGVGESNLDMVVEIPRSEASTKLKLAYAITIHRSQGSEYGTVIVPIYRSHGRMLQRNLLYTAVTRARTKVWLIGDRPSLSRAIANNQVVQRGTALARSLSEEILSGVEGVEGAANGTERNRLDLHRDQEVTN